MRISDWSSDVCSSDLLLAGIGDLGVRQRHKPPIARPGIIQYADDQCRFLIEALRVYLADNDAAVALSRLDDALDMRREVLSDVELRSEEHTSELKSLMRISYAVFCLTKTK